MPPGFFRLLLAFVVVLHHSFPLRLGAWAVGMFFVLSGYWISRMWREKYVKLPQPVLDFWVSRWWRIAPLVFVVHLISILIVVAGFPLAGMECVYNWQWWGSQPLIAGSTLFGRLLPPSWSIDVEMQFYILAPFLLLLASRANVGLVITMICVLIAWSAFRITNGTKLETACLDVYLFLFFIGYAADRFSYKPSTVFSAISGSAFVVLVVAAYLFPATRSLVWIRGSDASSDSPLRHSASFILLAVLIALPFAIGTVYRTSSAWDRWLGDLSFPLYLFHWIPRDGYYAMVDWTLPAWRNGALLIGNVLIAVMGAVLLLQFVDRPARSLRNRWLIARGKVISVKGSKVESV